MLGVGSTVASGTWVGAGVGDAAGGVALSVGVGSAGLAVLVGVGTGSAGLAVPVGVGTGSVGLVVPVGVGTDSTGLAGGSAGDTIGADRSAVVDRAAPTVGVDLGKASVVGAASAVGADLVVPLRSAPVNCVDAVDACVIAEGRINWAAPVGSPGSAP